MEENLEKLRKIGVKEIAKQTKISTSRIQDILDKQFEHTQRVHLVGFLQILEREYKLDLSSVLKAYDECHNAYTITEKPVEKEKSVQVQDLSLDTQKQRYDAIDERKKQANSKQKFYLTLVSVAIVIFAYLIYQNIASKYKSQPNATTETAQVSTLESTDTPISQEEGHIENQNLQDDMPAQEVSPATIEPSVQDNPESTHTQSTQAPNNAMTLTTNMDLWFDIVDLDTNRRKYQGVTSDTYTIKTNNHRWLLAFGHSNFTLVMNGEPFAFTKSNYPLYFIYEPDNGFQKINLQTYKNLAEQVQ